MQLPTSGCLRSVPEMKPRELLGKWVQLFNQADIEALVALYAPDAICHQVVTEPLHGREAIRLMLSVLFWV